MNATKLNVYSEYTSRMGSLAAQPNRTSAKKYAEQKYQPLFETTMAVFEFGSD